MSGSLQPTNRDIAGAVRLWRTGVSLTPCFSGVMIDQAGGGNRFNGFAIVRETVETVCPEATTLCTPLKQGVTKETVGWTTDARNGFPLPFGRGEGQGEGTNENTPTGSTFPLSPALSPSAGERENRATSTVFCRPSSRFLSNERCLQPIGWSVQEAGNSSNFSKTDV